MSHPRTENQEQSSQDNATLQRKRGGKEDKRKMESQALWAVSLPRLAASSLPRASSATFSPVQGVLQLPCSQDKRDV